MPRTTNCGHWPRRTCAASAPTIPSRLRRWSMKFRCNCLKGIAVTANNHGQFLALAAKAMRNLLIDHAAARGRQKRGGSRERLSLDEVLAACDERNQELVDLDEALERFSQIEAARPGRRAALFRRLIGSGNGPNTRGVSGHSEARLGGCQGVAAS